MFTSLKSQVGGGQKRCAFVFACELSNEHSFCTFSYSDFMLCIVIASEGLRPEEYLLVHLLGVFSRHLALVVAVFGTTVDLSGYLLPEISR